MSSCILVDVAGKFLRAALPVEAPFWLSGIEVGLQRQCRKHQPHATGDQDGSRQCFPMALESRRGPIPIVTHTVHPSKNPAGF
ncbi:hypothetical protein [Mesorhizobium sp.]|uniref:hypothetical protein n=1 Tax=Mesorhizobium sp. TaxID=1871066 RepID=UPI0025D4D1C2|nr:hypothetical protein [Mesorhizobium sp.]